MASVNFAGFFSDFMNQKHLRVVHIAMPGYNTGPGAHVSFTDKGPGLMCCLKGHLVCRLWSNGQFLMVPMSPGAAVFRMEKSWLTVATPLKPFECIYVSFGKFQTTCTPFEVSKRHGRTTSKKPVRIFVDERFYRTISIRDRLIAEVIQLYANRQDNPPFLHALVTAMIFDLMQLFNESTKTYTSKAWNTFEAARYYVLSHCRLPLSRKLVATALGISPRHLSRLFVRFGDDSFGHYLQRVRFEQACKMLLKPGVVVCDVAAMCGFTSTNYFSRAFRRKFGVSPGTYRSGFAWHPKNAPDAQFAHSVEGISAGFEA